MQLTNMEDGVWAILFTGPHCKQCPAAKKKFWALDPDYPGILFKEVNVKEEPGVAKEFAVQSVPAVRLVTIIAGSITRVCQPRLDAFEETAGPATRDFLTHLDAIQRGGKRG